MGYISKGKCTLQVHEGRIDKVAATNGLVHLSSSVDFGLKRRRICVDKTIVRKFE